MAALLRSGCKLFVSLKAKQLQEQMVNWRGLQDGMAEKLFVSTPSKDIQHLESIPRNTHMRGCCKMYLGSFITSGL